MSISSYRPFPQFGRSWVVESAGLMATESVKIGLFEQQIGFSLRQNRSLFSTLWTVKRAADIEVNTILSRPSREFKIGFVS